MMNHNVVEIAGPLEAWPDQDGRTTYLVHGRKPSLYSSRIELLDFQGCGVIAGKFVRTTDELRSLIERHSNILGVIDDMVNATGSVCVHVYDHETQKYYIMNDPLGGGQIYCGKTTNRTAFSSDLCALAELYVWRGEPLRKNVKYFSAGLLTYTQTYGADSPYQDVEVLRRGDYICLDREGRAEVIHALPQERLYISNVSYQDELAMVRNNVLENVFKASELSYDLKISHLTAGFDSRLVLAAMMKSEVEKEFMYYCIKTSSDAPIAYELGGHLGLTFVNNDGNPRGKGYQKDYFEYIKNGPRASQLVIAEGLDSRYLPQGNLVFQGGYGEAARTFNSFRWDGDLSNQWKLAYSLWRWINFPSEQEISSSIWSKSYVEEVVCRLSVHVARFLEMSLPTDYFTNYLYLEGRNRIFIGARSYYASSYRTQFDPLYSRHLASITAQLDFERRRANFVGLDLMRDLCPHLLSLPFDNEKITSAYIKERGPVEASSFSGASPNFVDLDNHVKSNIPWPGEASLISEDDVALARSLRIPEIVAYGVRVFGPKALDVISSTEEGRSIFNGDCLGDLNGPLEALTRERLMLLHGVISSLVLADMLS